MEVLVIVLGFAAFLYWKLLKAGGVDFWKVAAKHPDEAYEWFMTDDSWVVVDPQDPMSLPPEPKSDYNGPFPLFIPKLGGRRITVYGRFDSIKDSQQRFMQKFS